MSVSVSVSVSVQCSYSWCIIAKQKQMQENLLLAHHDLVTRANQVAANLPMRSMRNGFSCDYDWGASPFRGKIVWTNGRKGPPQGMFIFFSGIIHHCMF